MIRILLLSTVCIASTESSLARLEAIARRNALEMGARTSQSLFVYCEVRVAKTGKGEFEIRRLGPTCETAALDVLKTLEARNVR